MKSRASTLFLSDASILDLGSHASSPVVVATNPAPKTSSPPECESEPLFEPGDGDMQISVNGTRFEAHKYLVKRLRGLWSLLDKQHSEINIQRNDVTAEDFHEMFKVLYASVITAPFKFNSNTLISTLRVATLFEYQLLRDYCIQSLEMLDLDAVKRIAIARELHLPTWEGPAYHELGMRDEPITREEANIIGLDAFVCIAEMREKEQRRRGKEVDAMGGERDVKPTRTVQVSTQTGTGADAPQGDVPHTPSQRTHPSPHKTSDTANIGGERASQVGPMLAGVELNGPYTWKPKRGYMVEIPGCGCTFKDNNQQLERKCAMYPCNISILKSIEARQSAQASRISDLQASVNKLNDSITAEPTLLSSRMTTTGLKTASQKPVIAWPGDIARLPRPMEAAQRSPFEGLFGGKKVQPGF